MWFIIVLYVILCAWLFLGRKRPTFVNEEGDKWYVNSIGNILCSYFYKMGNSWSKGETFVWDEQFKNEFYKNLPTKLDPPKDVKIPAYKNNRTSFENLSAWICDSEEAVNFWKSMKPFVHKIIGEALEKSGLRVNQTKPVIHFRCSDVPFRKSDDYHFQKYKFFKDAVGSDNEVEIITCHTHLSEVKNQKACSKYVELLIKELSPTKATVQCRHYFEDFAVMFYAPKVISTGSSMSFMAGFFGHGEFITAGHFTEGSENTCKICKYSGVDVLHSDVSDYYDIDSVHKKLVD